MTWRLVGALGGLIRSPSHGTLTAYVARRGRKSPLHGAPGRMAYNDPQRARYLRLGCPRVLGTRAPGGLDAASAVARHLVRWPGGGVIGGDAAPGLDSVSAG